jgi:hypothetical protein
MELNTYKPVSVAGPPKVTPVVNTLGPGTFVIMQCNFQHASGKPPNPKDYVYRIAVNLGETKVEAQA